MEKLNFDNISIRGRFVFSIDCLLSVINKYEIITDLDAFILNLLEFTNCSQLELWEKKILLCLPQALNNETLAYNFNYDDIDEDEQKLLTDVLLEVLNVGRVNLYKEFDDSLTKKHLDNLINLLNNSNIRLPGINKLIFSKITENDGWGNEFYCKIGYDKNYEYEEKYIVEIL